MPSSSLFKIADMLPAVGGRMLHGDPNVNFTNFCIDSRYVDQRSLFVPLMGQTRDGHQYIIDAISKGAVAALVRVGHHQVHEILDWLRDHSGRGSYDDFSHVCVIEVRHTLVALQKLAEWYRMQFDAQVVGITGSVGKTGTKETLIQLLSTRWQTVGTEKNFNNEIGVPLALSRINHRTNFAVVEMAMRARGEISLLSRIAHPDLAIITNTSGSHVGRLGSFEEIYKAKAEIVDGLKPGGTVLLNRDDNNVKETVAELKFKERTGHPIGIKFFDSSDVYARCGIPPFAPPGGAEASREGIPPAEVWAEDVVLGGLEGSTLTLCSTEERVPVRLRLLGRGNIENLIAASAVARELGMTLKEIADAAPALLPAPQRLNLYNLGKDLYLIDDCYNSSPASIRDSLELMLAVDRRFKKVIILGDMLELGKYETLLHRQVASTALNLPFDTIYAVGPRMNAVNEVEGNEDIELYYIEGRHDYETSENGERSDQRFGAPPGGRPQQRGEETLILDDRAAAKLSALLLNHLEQAHEPTVVLVKGSRALHLERVVNDLLSGMTYE